MLNSESLERTEFNADELVLRTRKRLRDFDIKLPKNLEQLLVWTASMSQYNYGQYLALNQEVLTLATDDPNRKDLEKRAQTFKYASYTANRVKDFYLTKLINSQQAEIIGHVAHATKSDTYYIVIAYGESKHLMLANEELLAKQPIQLIEFSTPVPQSLAEIHSDEQELLFSVGKFIRKYFNILTDFKKYDQLTKEHNRVVNELLSRVKQGIVKVIEPTIIVKDEKPKMKEAVVVPPPPTPQTIIKKNDKPIMVVKKRKFFLNKD